MFEEISTTGVEGLSLCLLIYSQSCECISVINFFEKGRAIPVSRVTRS